VVLAGQISGTGILAFTRYLSLALFFPITLAAVQSEQDVRRALWACVGVMILVFPYALRQLLRFGGRLGVGLYEPNYLALALVLLIPLAIVIARQQQTTGQQAFWGAGAGILCISLMLTSSRGGFLGFLTAMALLCFKSAQRPFLLASTAMVGLLLFVFVVPTNLGQRLRASFDTEVQDAGVAASTEAHLDLFKAGWGMIGANPVFGVGLGQFKKQSRVYYDVAKPRIAHNTYIQIAAESGIPALIAFLFFIGLTLRALGHIETVAEAQGRLHMRQWAVALQAGLGGYLVSAFFLSAQFEKFFWLIVFLSIAMERILVAEATEPEEEPIGEPPWAKWYQSGSSGVP
jgi:O-antigen ligase